MKIRIGTRGSQLALWQAHETARRLEAAGHEAEIVTIRTTGDKRTDVPLAAIGGKGLFIKELEEALDCGEIDAAVHSLKDVPSIVPERFTLAAFLERADPRDAWVQIDGKPISEMPEGSVIGTSAPRRRAQLLARWPHLRVEEIRGNVDTRIRKLHDGLYAGAVLASAGLTRLGRTSDITAYFSVDEMVPAAGQGIVVIETLRDEVREAVAAINHEPSAIAARCERGVLQRFGTLLDCYSIAAVHAVVGERIVMRAFFGEGIRVDVTAATPDEAIERTYRELLALGAGAPAVQRAQAAKSGKVYLVGAGPGDPGLLTIKAAELIATADLVATDALVSKQILARIPKSAEVVYVGKRAAAHTLPQDQINQLLVDEAKKGKRVVRLKGGDPFVFGRGGEEAEELMAAGVPVEIVPGISSSIAGPAYAGIPVTHRAHSTSVTLVTGHESDESTGVEWGALAQLRGTIVFLMGLANLPLIVRKLREHGVPESRPVAVISKATTPEQRSVAGTLATIESLAAELPAPALIVVGDVVKLRETIGWFESKPLFGRRVVVTRAREQASQLRQLLEEAGAQVVEAPTIEIVPPESFASLDRAIDEPWHWLVFTSTNGVTSFFDRLVSKGKDARSLAQAKIAAVGEATAAALRARGIVPDLVPERFLSAALLPHLPEDQRGVRTAVVRAEEGRDELLDELRKRGGDVHLAVAYRTRPVAPDADELRAVDAITFTSASTVDNFFATAPTPAGALLASIGPVTSEALRKHGKEPDVEAEQATVAALCEAVIRGLRVR